MKCWVVVVSKDHINRGVQGGFIQSNHGKEAPLRRMTAGDWVICYSSKLTYAGKELLQAFTAIGEVADYEIYRDKANKDFMPYRKTVSYKKCNDVPIEPLIGELDFIKNKKSWGYPFRFGFFEIPQKDFEFIKSKMLK